LNPIAIPQSQQTIRLQNIRNQQQLILQAIAQLAQTSATEPCKSQKLLHVLSQTITQVEQLCAQQQLSPANLTGPSHQIYPWMKFLLDEHHLQSHLQTTQQVQQLVAETLVVNLTTYPGKPVAADSKKINIAILNIAGLYRCKSNTSGTISRTLDNRKMPQYVVEFVMYHKLLHKQHRENWGKSRLLVHTPEFRQNERKFKQYKQAQQWLEKLVRTD